MTTDALVSELRALHDKLTDVELAIDEQTSPPVGSVCAFLRAALSAALAGEVG